MTDAGSLRVTDKIADNPTAGTRLKGEFDGLWRVREGSFRIIYELRRSEVAVLVVRVANRKEVYR